MFKTIGEKAKNVKEAYAIKNDVEKIMVEVDYKGVVIKMKGFFETVSLIVDGQEDTRLLRAFNKTVRRMQKELRKKMQGRLGAG